MGTRSNLYLGQPSTTLAAVITGAASTSTTITFAEAFNDSDEPQWLDVHFGTRQFVRRLPLAAYETQPLFGVVGATLDASDTIRLEASADATINVKIDGYEVTTA